MRALFSGSLLGLIASAAIAVPCLASSGSASSASLRIVHQAGPAAGLATSAGYSMQHCLDAIGGRATSTSFRLTAGCSAIALTFNHPPFVDNPIPDFEATEGVLFTVALAADAFGDVDGDTLTWSATRSNDTPLPAWLAFEAGTRTFSGTPGPADVGDLDVKVVAADPASESASDVFRISVGAAAVNGAPLLDPIGNRVAVVGSPLAFTITAGDPDDDTLTFGATGLPDGATLSPGGSFECTPASDQAGDHEVTFTVDDGHDASDSETITITVSAGGAGVTSMNVAFDVYNQGRANALPSRVRAFLSDEAHPAHPGTGRDVELEVTLDPAGDCGSPDCTPLLVPGASSHYVTAFQIPAGGFGRHEIAGDAGNQALEYPDGTFRITSSDTTFSIVSFLFGRYLVVDADGARDEEGEKLDQSGQHLAALLENDTQGVLVPATGPTFAQLTHLSATFQSLSGGSGNGTPRLVVHLQGQGALAIRLGHPATYSDTDSALDDYSDVNLIGNDDAGRYDLSGLGTPGAGSATYDDALAAAGAFTITRIDFVADSGPAREYMLERINVGADPPP